MACLLRRAFLYPLFSEENGWIMELKKTGAVTYETDNQ